MEQGPRKPSQSWVACFHSWPFRPLRESKRKREGERGEWGRDAGENEGGRGNREAGEKGGDRDWGTVRREAGRKKEKKKEVREREKEANGKREGRN